MCYPENKGTAYLLRFPNVDFCKERLSRCIHLLTAETDVIYRAGCEAATEAALCTSGSARVPSRRASDDQLSINIVEVCLLLLYRMCVFLAEEGRLMKGLRAQLLSATARLLERCALEPVTSSVPSCTPLPPHTAALAAVLNELIAGSEST
jgi:hypothetical protein